MSLTDGVLLLFTASLTGWLLFDEVVTGWLKGPTILRIALLRQKRIDGAIFVGLLIILLYNNIYYSGGESARWLLSLLLLIAVYITWIRSPAVLFKNEGFYYSSFFIKYSKISEINLSEDGVLIFKLNGKVSLISIKTRDITDLEKIYHVMTDC